MLAVSLRLKSFDLSIFSDLKWCLHVFERPSMHRNSFVLRKKTERQGWDQVKGGGRECDGGGRWCCWLHHHENGDNKSIWHEKFKPIILDLMEIQARVRLTTPLFNNSASQDSLDDKAPFKVRLAALLSLVLTVDQHHQRECTSVFEPFCLL